MSSPLPAPLPSPQPVWGRFSADPRLSPGVRASDADRDVAAETVNAAFAQGRLDPAEHGDRLQAVLNAKRLGELTPLLSDITVVAPAGSSVEPPWQHAPSPAGGRQATWRAWLLVTIITNVVWLATWVASANAPTYYWPIWPMLGMAIPVLIMYLFPDGPDAAARERGRQRRLGRGPGGDRRLGS